MSLQHNGNPILNPGTIGGSITETSVDFEFDGGRMDWNELEVEINGDVRLQDLPLSVGQKHLPESDTSDTESSGDISTTTTIQYRCDVCYIAQFSSVKEAVDHENECQATMNARKQDGVATPTILGLNVEFPTVVVAAEPENTILQQPAPCIASPSATDPSTNNVIPSERPRKHSTFPDRGQDGYTNVVEAMDDSKSSISSGFPEDSSYDDVTNSNGVLNEDSGNLAASHEEEEGGGGEEEEPSEIGLGLHTNTTIEDMSLGSCSGVDVNTHIGKDLRQLDAPPDVTSPSSKRSQYRRTPKRHLPTTNSNTADERIHQDSVARLPVPETMLSIGTLQPNLPSPFSDIHYFDAEFVGAKPSFKGTFFRFNWYSGMWREIRLTSTAESPGRLRERSLPCPQEEIDSACALFQLCYKEDTSRKIIEPLTKHLGLLFLRYKSKLVNVIACVVPASTERNKAVEILRVATHATYRMNGFARLAMTLMLQGISDLSAQKYNKVVVNGLKEIRTFYTKCGFNVFHMAAHYENFKGGTGKHLEAFKIELNSKKLRHLMHSAIQRLRPYHEGEDTAQLLSPARQDSNLIQVTPTDSDRKRSRSNEGRCVPREVSVAFSKDDSTACAKRKPNTVRVMVEFHGNVEDGVLVAQPPRYIKYRHRIEPAYQRRIEPARKREPHVEQSRNRSSNRLTERGKEDIQELKDKCDVINRLLNSAHRVGDSVLVAWRGKFYPGIIEKVNLMAYIIRWLDGSDLVEPVDKGTFIFSGSASITH